jgi:hypothetical protein
MKIRLFSTMFCSTYIKSPKADAGIIDAGSSELKLPGYQCFKVQEQLQGNYHSKKLNEEQKATDIVV